jgi:hypothetical protein
MSGIVTCSNRLQAALHGSHREPGQMLNVMLERWSTCALFWYSHRIVQMIAYTYTDVSWNDRRRAHMCVGTRTHIRMLWHSFGGQTRNGGMILVLRAMQCQVSSWLVSCWLLTTCHRRNFHIVSVCVCLSPLYLMWCICRPSISLLCA